MKTKMLPLIGALFFSSMALADQPLLNVTLGVPYTVMAKANPFVEYSALTDVKIMNLKVNNASCPVKKMVDVWVSEYAQELAELKRQLKYETGVRALAKGESSFVFVGCELEQINSVEITTDKGIQTVRFDIDAEPVVTVKPLSEKKEAQVKKADPTMLDTIYKVSNYTCYQTKDEIAGVIELCSPLPANDVSEFTLPYGSAMSKPLFVERAKERARKARYIEFLETFPTEKPKFKEKKLPSVALPSLGDTIRGGRDFQKELMSKEAFLDTLFTRYENALNELVDLKISVPNLETEVVNHKKAVVRITKALEKNPEDQRLINNAKAAEDRVLFNLGKLEELAVKIPSKEQELAKKKAEIQEAQNEVIQLREIVKQSLESNPTEAK